MQKHFYQPKAVDVAEKKVEGGSCEGILCRLSKNLSGAARRWHKVVVFQYCHSAFSCPPLVKTSVLQQMVSTYIYRHGALSLRPAFTLAVHAKLSALISV